MKSDFGYVFPKLVALAEISISPPVSNACPERGAGALKRLKTRFRSRLNSDFLNALMQLTLIIRIQTICQVFTPLKNTSFVILYVKAL